MTETNDLKSRSIQQMAEKVKFLRTHEGLTLKDMASELRLHSMRIKNLETGEYRVDLQDLIRYCDFFGLDYEGFLFDKFTEFKAAYVADNEKMLKAIGYSV